MLPRMLYWYLGGIAYIVGALIYIVRFPEKCRPGKHDIWGSSHQIFHLFVISGVILHYLGSLDAYYYRVENLCPV
jgi:adiponectin receptor